MLCLHPTNAYHSKLMFWTICLGEHYIHMCYLCLTNVQWSKNCFAWDKTTQAVAIVKTSNQYSWEHCFWNIVFNFVDITYMKKIILLFQNPLILYVLQTWITFFVFPIWKKIKTIFHSQCSFYVHMGALLSFFLRNTVFAILYIFKMEIAHGVVSSLRGYQHNICFLYDLWFSSCN